MTEKNIFAYKLILSLNISDFNFFCVWKLHPPGKSHLLFPSSPPLKFEVLSSPPFLKIWLEIQPPKYKDGGGGRVNYDDATHKLESAEEIKVWV